MDILLDTNVVSEFMRRDPNPAVIEWLDGQRAETVWLSVITIAEIRFGLAIMPDGRRRDHLEQLFGGFLLAGFGDRLLDFDQLAAEAYAEIRSSRRAIGKPVRTLDAQIAAIAKSRGISIATRNIADFEGTGPVLINPFEHQK